MMFGKTVLFRDTNAEAAAQVWSALKANGIRYEMKTKTGKSSFKRTLEQHSSAQFMMGGVPASQTAVERTFLYVIYVSKKDLDKAKDICNL